MAQSCTERGCMMRQQPCKGAAALAAVMLLLLPAALAQPAAATQYSNPRCAAQCSSPNAAFLSAILTALPAVDRGNRATQWGTLLLQEVRGPPHMTSIRTATTAA